MSNGDKTFRTRFVFRLSFFLHHTNCFIDIYKKIDLIGDEVKQNAEDIQRFRIDNKKICFLNNFTGEGNNLFTSMKSIYLCQRMKTPSAAALHTSEAINTSGD